MYPGYMLVVIATSCLFSKFFIKRENNEVNNYTYQKLESEVHNGRRLFLYEHEVLDMSSYMDLHPGNKLVDEYVGTEISRYIYGGFPCGNGYIYPHSDITDIVVSKLHCGTVTPLFSLIQATPGLEAKKDVWKLVDRERTTPIHSIIKFSCGDTKVTTIVPGVNFCGSYLSV